VQGVFGAEHHEDEQREMLGQVLMMMGNKKEGKATPPEFPLLTTILLAYIRKCTTTMMPLTLSKRYQKSD
jgi:hypothetical protein